MSIRHSIFPLFRRSIAPSCIVATLSLMIQSGCKEPFPTYEEPANVLEASIQRNSGDTLFIVLQSDGSALQYDALRLKILVKNIYPQLLQGEEALSGRVDFFMTSPLPKVGLPYKLSRTDLAQPPIFQNAVAIPPGQAAEFRVDWSPSSSASDPLWSGVPYVEKILADSTRIHTYAPVTFKVDATVRVFERVQAIQATSFTFTQIFVVTTVPVKQ